jgi:Na+-transporting methylmalonyl-CoA/oxaloacetate decarboxylase gamma subunit
VNVDMSVGYAITLLGMGIVFCFIGLLALAIHLLSRFRGEARTSVTGVSGELVAVIGAALHARRLATKAPERRDKS